jgi:4-hydroxybenzoate polyprenyltransferase
MVNLDKIWEKLPAYEKDSSKYIAILFPCYYSIQYLFNPDFKDIPVVSQCMLALATAIIMYGIFFMGTLLSSITQEVYTRMGLRTFRSNIINISLLIIIGHFYGYSIALLRLFCCCVLFFSFIIYIFLAFEAYKRNKARPRNIPTNKKPNT